MKRILSAFFIASTLWITTSCYGPFKVTTKLHEWNATVGTPFVNALVFLGLCIIPVYELFLLGDALIFNTIEFWGGSNPVSMKEGDKETQFVQRGKSLYEITATKNKFTVVALEGKHKGRVEVLKFDAVSEKWIAVTNEGVEITLIDFEQGQDGQDYININTAEGVISIANVEENFVKAAASNTFEAAELVMYAPEELTVTAQQ